ncbi:hypothetical protein GLGR_3015 [Leminorella grimontii ATCC 33999 = DSM 5078]|nr:hypothetical protein GLGR_3015 [Leminorella grimontii ATCC 33999 = DSM 5078]
MVAIHHAVKTKKTEIARGTVGILALEKSLIKAATVQAINTFRDEWNRE